ncbi:MAG: lytic murein transglycosylase B [Aeromonas sp.]
MRRLVSLLSLALAPLIGGCSSAANAETSTPLLVKATNSAFINQTPPAATVPRNDDFLRRPAVEQFIAQLVAKHGFSRSELEATLGQAERLDWVIRLMDAQGPSAPKPVGPTGAWTRYRKQFITPDNVQNGVAFWQEHAQTLARAEREFGVPSEIMVGIMGVETRWGRVMGKTRILDALATLAFDYPRRAAFFTSELETFLLMSRDEGLDATEPKGSYAGAMGYGQFMPSSFKRFALDFNRDGHTNLWDPEDAIGSIANYFKHHGWKTGQKVAVKGQGKPTLNEFEHGFQTKYPLGQLKAAGLTPSQSLGAFNHASLLRLDIGTGYEYWYGLPNFYTITRYNHSTHYAMAVWQLGNAVKAARP